MSCSCEVGNSLAGFCKYGFFLYGKGVMGLLELFFFCM